MRADAVSVMRMDGYGRAMECQGMPGSGFVTSSVMYTTIPSDLDGNTIANVTDRGSVKSISRTVSVSSIVTGTGSNLEIGVAVFVKHVMHDYKMSSITRADGNGTTVVLKGILESDFVVGKITDVVLRDTRDVSWMRVGIPIEIVMKSKCGMGIGSARMDGRCRRKGSSTWT